MEDGQPLKVYSLSEMVKARPYGAGDKHEQKIVINLQALLS